MPLPDGFDFGVFAESMLDAVVLADEAGTITYVNGVAARMFQYEAAELVGSALTMLMPERYREAHVSGMQRIANGAPARFVGRTLELEALRRDGSEFPIELSLSSSRTAPGIVFSAVIRDTSEKKAAERRSRAQHALTRLIAESRTLVEAVARVLETVCNTMEWDMGAMWVHDPRVDALRCMQFWDSLAPRRSEFEKSTLQMTFGRGEGLPGSTWAAGEALWMTEVSTQTNFPRAKVAADLDLKTAFAFPIIDPAGKTVGVLEVFTVASRPRDTALVEMMEDVGRQIGSLLERAYAVEAVLSIVEQMQVGLLVYRLEDLTDDRSLRLISVNPAAVSILGIAAEEIVGKTIDESFPALRASGLAARFREVVQTQQSMEVDGVVYSDDRVDQATFAVKAFPLPSNSVGVAFENVTKQHVAERLIAGERRVLESVVRGLPLAAVLAEIAAFCDEQAPLLIASMLLRSGDGDTLEYGASPRLPVALAAATAGAKVGDAGHPAALAVAREEIIVVESISSDPRAASIRSSALAHGLRACWAVPIVRSAHEVIGAMLLFSWQERSPDAHEREVVEFAGRISGLVIDRQRSEDALRQNEARFRALIESSADAIHLADADGRITYRSPASRRMLGYADADIIGRSFTELVHPDDLPAVTADLKGFQSGKQSIKTTLRLRREDGAWIRVEATGTNLLHDDVLKSIVGNFRDVTEQYEAEQTLKESEERFNAFMHYAPVVAFIKDAQSRYVWFNKRVEELFGFNLSQAQGKTDFEIFDRPTAEQNVANDRLVIDGSRPIDSSTTMRTAEGVERSWLIIKFPLKLGSGETHVGGVAVDVTERRALETQLERTERIAGLGRVAANIAHEMNNVMMGILPFAEVIKRRAAQDTALQDAATHIMRSIHRGKRVTEDILRFTRSSDPVFRCFDSRVWLEEMASEFRLTLDDRIELRVVPPADRVHIRGDALQLQMALTNLVVNARDAIEGGGIITIAARHCAAGESLPFALVRHPEQYVHVSVSDTGRGIPPAILGRIFEPLFTTKRNGGTGLGLAITHQTVSRNGGEIHVESREGEGTTFHLLLPYASVPSDPVRIATPDGDLPPIKRVLLVEDDESVAEGLLALLQADDVSVRWIRTGGETVPAVASFNPDILLLDVGLPDVNGFDVYRRLRTRYPHLPTIFSTGHGEEGTLSQFTDGPVAHLLKPYDYTVLLRTMRDVMKKRG